MKTKNTTTFPQTVEIPQPLKVHPSVSPKAAALLLKTADELASSPRNYNQNMSCNILAIKKHNWGISPGDAHSCETACCIYGWMRDFAGLDPLPAVWANPADNGVGLTPKQFNSIFYVSKWPAQLIDKNWSHPRDIPASGGIARIEHFLRTGA